MATSSEHSDILKRRRSLRRKLKLANQQNLKAYEERAAAERKLKRTDDKIKSLKKQLSELDDLDVAAR